LLATIVSRKAFIKLRRKYPLNYAPEDIGVIKEATAALLDADLSEQEVEADLSEKVATILSDLTKREREVVKLFLDRQQERSLQEIAKACHPRLFDRGRHY